jgi:hypothetical protein
MLRGFLPNEIKFCDSQKRKVLFFNFTQFHFIHKFPTQTNNGGYKNIGRNGSSNKEERNELGMEEELLPFGCGK